jgi:polyvinyl alcohol dehydrogenase (cytochrome)
MRIRPRSSLVVLGALAVLLAGCSSTSSSPSPQTSTTEPPSSTSTSTSTSGVTTTTTPVAGTAVWPSYHADLSRTGSVTGASVLSSVTRKWSTDLGGAVYGQPVVGDGRIFVGTEQNRVVALDPTTGAVIWSASLGTPLTNVQSVAGCGDIDPLGITSTPAIDPATNTVYVVGEVSDGGGAVHHQLEGLNMSTGAVTLSETVDPPLPSGEKAVNLLQRTSLAIANGRVYVGYGGNYGDCGNYHGWVVGVSTSGPADLVSFEVASDGQGGAVWQSGGAPAVDAQGDIYVTTGNANPDPPQGGPDPKKYTESVVKLSPTLTPLASFKDTVAGGDEDLSTGNPVLLPNGDVFAVGKTDIGYVLKQSDLTQVATVKGICGSDPDGGPAYDASTNQIFVPCRDGGIQTVDLSDNTLGSRLSGANSAPVLIDGDLWALQYPTGVLTQFDVGTGKALQTQSVGSSVANFASPSTNLSLVLVGTTSGVTAFGS